MRCLVCEGTAVIDRPMREIKRLVAKEVLADCGWIWDTVEEIEEIGGIDACPACAAAAEAEWISRR